MNKVLMILTHNRLDCLKLNLDMLADSGALPFFDHIVFLLNGVNARHLHYVKRFAASHPEATWDMLFGPGTRPEGISSLQNECVNKYPNSLYMKIDEDIFVPKGWAEQMLQAYEDNRENNNLALITPLIPNNSFCLHHLLTQMYPDFLEEHKSKFNCPPTPEINSHTWYNPAAGEWASRKFINLNEANTQHRVIISKSGIPLYHEFSDRFSIGCICYDYTHWKKMGCIPVEDEPAWCSWIEKNNQINIIDHTQIVLHYSFFVQQDWLDRSNLLEDIRYVNLPHTMRKMRFMNYTAPRLQRTVKQIPHVIKRRLHIHSE